MKNYLAFLIYCIALQSCTTTPLSVITFSLDHKIDTTKQTQLILRDSIHPIGLISSFAPLSDSTFLITSNGCLVCYNIKGEQIHIANNQGRARNEAMNPAAIYVSEHYIYLWDADLLKLLVYDKSLNFHNSYSGFTNALSKFTIIADQYFCYIPMGGKLANAVVVYDLQANQDQHIKTVSQADVLLKLKQGVAAVGSSQDSLWFCNPASLTIYIASIRGLSDITTTQMSITDPDFQNTPFEGDAIECINNNRNTAFNYIFQNSTVLDIVIGSTYVYLLAELVESETAKKIRIYKFAKNNTPIETYTLPYLPMTVWKLSENLLQYITIENTANNQKTTLRSLSF